MAQKLKEELNSAAYARDLQDAVKSSDLPPDFLTIWKFANNDQFL